MKKVFIAIPCMDSVPVEFAQSFATMDKPENCVVSFMKGSLVYDSRNKLCEQAIKCKSDYVLWLDSDMVFPKNLIEVMLEHMKDKDIVSGLYFRRVYPFTPVLNRILNDDGTASDYDDYPEDSVFECEGFGFGCVMMKTSVLYDMLMNKEALFVPVNNFGEDLSFLWRAKNLGYKCYVDSRIKCGHIGHMMICEDTYKTTRR